MKKKPVYKTWIRVKKIILFWFITVILFVVSVLPDNYYIHLLLLFCVLPPLYISLILTQSYYYFAPAHKNYQSKIHDLIIKNLEWDGNGKLLDIGSGSGSLIIKAAKAFPKGFCTGVDYWGSNWEYSKNLCETNAKIEQVSERITFIKASASKLPFPNSEFDAVISCLTFHEVKDESDKIKVLKEAFRVLKPGGSFVFMDLFMDSKIYGDFNELQDTLKKFGLSEFKAVKLDSLMTLPGILKHKKVLGNAVVITGKK